MLEDGFDDELVGGAVVRDDVDVGVKAVDDLERVRERVLVELVGVRPDRLDQGAVDVEGDERLARRLRRVVDRVPSAHGLGKSVAGGVGARSGESRGRTIFVGERAPAARVDLVSPRRCARGGARWSVGRGSVPDSMHKRPTAVPARRVETTLEAIGAGEKKIFILNWRGARARVGHTARARRRERIRHGDE